jgi:hypothetical protein
MRKLTMVVLLLLAGALPAQALTTKDILSLVAMPLAVAAVADLSGVPQDQLTDVISTLNQADVPPSEFVQVVRYVPAALVEQPMPQDQTFAQWLDAQAQNTTGPQLVTTIDNRLATTYGVTPVVEPDRVVYVDDSYIPDAVMTRMQRFDPVALAAMPLAVAAMSELTGVPQNQLADLAAALNQADVPPTQFVQVVSYAPQTLTVQQPAQQPPAFVDFVQTQTRQGVRGPALVTRIDRELPRFTVASAPMHPHGGPPGQLKKQLGLQTGAEVVHGAKRGRQFAPPNVVAPVVVTRVEHEHGNGRGHGDDHGHGRGREVQVVPPPMASAAPPVIVQQPPQPVFVPPGQAKKGGGDEHGHGNGNGGGKGRGHGKD